MKLLKMAKLAKQESGIHLVKRVREDGQLQVLREGSTGRVVVMLPRVWAVADAETVAGPVVDDSGVQNGPSGPWGPELVVSPEVETAMPPARVMPVEVAFYRKYTEAMLRRYLRLSMAAGRVPVLLGRELFRGNVSHCRMHSFEDVVIFCHDMEKLLLRLPSRDQELIKRVALQAYSQAEAAAAMGISLRTCMQQYGEALDRLTGRLLKAKMLELLKSCQ